MRDAETSDWLAEPKEDDILLLVEDPQVTTGFMTGRHFGCVKHEPIQ